MHEVEPSVSTDSMFLTSTFFVAILAAVRDKETVTVARSPSGTLATMIPIQKTKFVTRSVPFTSQPMRKKDTPKKMATADTM